MASSKSTSSALAAAWPSQLMVTRIVKSISSESSEMSSSLFLRHHMCDSMIPEGARQKLHSGIIPQSFFGQNDFPLRGRGGGPPNSAKEKFR